MPPKFKSPLRDQQFLIPPDINDWVPENHIVWFYIDTVQALNLPIDDFYVNNSGDGKPQYDPYKMLTLLVYCITKGVRSSREIEYATYESVAVRIIIGNLHPDHDTITEFRRNNKKIIEKAFVAILCLAERCHMRKLGNIPLKPDNIKEHVSKLKNPQTDPFIERIRYFQSLFGEIMTQMDASDNDPDPCDTLPASFYN